MTKADSPDHRLQRIAAEPDAAPLTPQQKKFNALLARIEVQRQLLAQWQDLLPRLETQHVNDMRPLLGEHTKMRLALVRRLDEAACAGGRMAKADRETLHEVIAELAMDLADVVEDEGERNAMKALYNRYADSDFDAEQAEAHEEIRQLAREAFGLDLDGVDLDSPEAMIERVEAQMQETARKAEEEREAHRAKRARKPTAREQRAQAEAQQATQSIRAIYRRLASLLHPDREPDEAERARKTVLMQRANQAYEAGRLLELLEIQQQALGADARRMSGLDDAQLKAYNRVLSEQLSDLQQQVEAEEAQACFAAGLAPRGRLSPAVVEAAMRERKRELRDALQGLQQLVRALEMPAALKAWLKQERAARRAAAQDPFAYFED